MVYLRDWLRRRGGVGRKAVTAKHNRCSAVVQHLVYTAARGESTIKVDKQDRQNSPFACSKQIEISMCDWWVKLLEKSRLCA